SLFSLYRTYFHKKRNLKAVILEVSWSEEYQSTLLKLLYINDGNVSETVISVNLNYYSAKEWPDNYIGTYYMFGGNPFFPKVEPLLIQPKTKEIVEYQFKLSATEVEEIKKENRIEKDVSAVLKFKRLTDEGYWFNKLYSRGLASTGAPFTYSFCPEDIINLNPSLLDDTALWVQHHREKQQVPPLKVVLRYRIYKLKDWLLLKLRLHPLRKMYTEQDSRANSEKPPLRDDSSE
ncbi:MAG: hypothetical protein LWX51_03405, partial [Deltaproteobacteria bacterium]|nr:hypothetical protein [Deltaproteobacteria bacterium]